MLFSVKEIFLTIQGEGFNAGKTAVFCRFSGCNLWNGKPASKKRAVCNFCDTDFVGTNGVNGGKYNLESLVNMICSLWPNDNNNKFLVFTGGEPLLQINFSLLSELKKNNFFIAIETNGTISPPKGIDWICVSPKANSKIVLNKGNEIKIVYPQKGMNLQHYEKFNFDHFYLQPLYNKNFKKNTKDTINYILKNPKWKLSIQSHKYLGIM